MPCLVSTSAAYCPTSSPGHSCLSILVTVHFLGDELNTLTSKSARPLLTPYQLKIHA